MLEASYESLWFVNFGFLVFLSPLMIDNLTTLNLETSDLSSSTISSSQFVTLKSRDIEVTNHTILKNMKIKFDQAKRLLGGWAT